MGAVSKGESRPRLFKYVTADTAQKILDSTKLRWSSPFLFNDPFDVQFDLHLEFDEATVVDSIMNELWDIYLGRKSLPPNNSLGQVFQLFLKHVTGLNKDELFERQGLRPAIVQSIHRTEQLIPELHATRRAILADAKMLCLSEISDNILMWSHYAQQHMGAVIGFEANDAESVFQKAEKVAYSGGMPRLMTEEDMVQFFLGYIIAALIARWLLVRWRR